MHKVENESWNYLTYITLDGEFSSIPNFEAYVPIRFSMRPTSDWRLVEKPLMLTVDGDYDEKIHFTDNKIGGWHWMRINRVLLYDIWSEFEKSFVDHLSEEEPAQRKVALEAKPCRYLP